VDVTGAVDAARVAGLAPTERGVHVDLHEARCADRVPDRLAVRPEMQKVTVYTSFVPPESWSRSTTGGGFSTPALM
jgi:hypothetical protein